jgi:hypothetical protein
MDLPPELGVALLVELSYAIAFFKHDLGDLLSVRALV